MLHRSINPALPTLLFLCLLGACLVESHAADTKPWTLGTTNGRQHLITPEGKPFLVFGLSHASGAWQGLLGPKKLEALTALRQDLRDLKFNAVGYVPDLGVEFNYIHNADRLPGSPGTVTGQGQRKHLYEDVFDPAFHARLQKHIRGIADKTAKDAHCIGYWWTDIPVWNPGQQKQKFGLSYVDFIRALPEGAAGRVRFESWKKENAAARDEAFHVLIARELYTVTAAAYREFAPGKLIFSERYNTIPGAPLEIIAEAGKVVDVISFQPYEKTLKGDILDQVHAMTGKPIILSDWSLSFPVEGHDNTMWPQFPTPAEAAAGYESYLTSAFAKPYILGYYKCQYRDAVLPTGQLKQGLRTVNGELRKDWARSIARIHRSLLAAFEKEGTARVDKKQDSAAADPIAAVFQRMKHGICVGNFERDQDLTAVTELDADYLDSVLGAGFKSIRFFFNNHKQPEFYATNVAYALKQGLVVNVCMFAFTKDRQQYVHRWTEIATFYKDHPESLVFEMLNEPSLAPKLNDPVEVMDWINAAVSAIRAVSPQRVLLLGGPSYMQAPFLSKYVTPEYLTYTLPGGGGYAEDRYVMGAFHMYEPHAYTMPKGKLVTVDDFPGWKKLVTDNLDLAAAWGKKWNKRVVLTEWGAQNVPKQRDDFLAYTKFVFDEVNQRDIASIYYAGLPRNSLMASWNILDTEFGWDQGVLDILTRTKAKPAPPFNQLANSEFSEFEGQGTDRSIKAWKVSAGSRPSVVNSASLSGVFALKLDLDTEPVTLSQDTLTMIESWQKTDPMFAHETALQKPFIHLRHGNTYRLTFLARTEMPDAIATARLENASENGAVCFTSKPLPLATRKEEYAVEYTHTGDDIMNARVALTFSGAGKAVFVDRVMLRSHREVR